jgi:F-type H+-transporting ATPase subunit gamma
VGYRLSSKLEQDKRVMTSLQAAGVFAEIEPLLSELTSAINEVTTGHPHTRIAMLYHDELSKKIRFESLLSGLRNVSTTEQHLQAPLLNLHPAVFFKSLLEEYVLAKFNHILTRSFFSENQTRVQHLESALHEIEKQSNDMAKRLNQLRQEQITEELETILLNSGPNTQ